MGLQKQFNLMLLVLMISISLCLVEVQASPMKKNHTSKRIIYRINKRGPYIGVIVPNSYELAPLLTGDRFLADTKTPHVDLAGRRFRVGSIRGHRVIVVLTGLAMLNAGTTTQKLLDVFDIVSVVHYGISGSSNSSLSIGDVSIASSWAHTGLWNWQRFGQGPSDQLSLEPNGDFTRELGYLHFGDFNVPVGLGNATNLLNNIFIQREEVFPVSGVPEVRQQIFFVPVTEKFYKLAQKLEGLKLKSCLNATTCLSSKPKVVLGLKGTSSNIFLDNAAYRGFLFQNYNVSIVDMEFAAIALRSYAHEMPFIIIRSVSDLAGGSSKSNEAIVFSDLAAENDRASCSEIYRVA